MEKFLTNMFTKLGENNKALYSVLAIAACKGIFRPMFTMMDKKTDPQTKKYTAIREGLTEVIAAGVYLGVDKLSELAASPIAKKAGKDLGQVKSSLGFLGVCASAAFIIPATCNLTLKPIMNSLEKKKNNKTLNTYPNTTMTHSTGMRV